MKRGLSNVLSYALGKARCNARSSWKRWCGVIGCGVLILAGMQRPAHGQWLTQTFSLKAGWNAVYLHVDASHVTLDELVGADETNPIEEVWLWTPDEFTLQFIDSPQMPVSGTPWSSWNRLLGPSSVLQRLIGNSAYLVRVADGAPDYTWNVKGRPMPPKYQWTSTGLNFLGFPTDSSAPSFEDFLAKAPGLLPVLELFAYQGGGLGPDNPVKVFDTRGQPVNRGEAYWMRTEGLYNRYFGPFEVLLQQPSGFQFGDTLGALSFRLRNLVAEPLTVTLTLAPSEAPPEGAEAIAGTPPVLVRGELNTVDLTHAFSELSEGPMQWELAAAGQPGSEIEVVLGVNRSAMIAPAGSLYAGIGRFTDSLGFSRVDIPVTAGVASPGGLWLGEVLVNEVAHYLTVYQRDESGHPVMDETGKYAVAGVNTSLGRVAEPYPLRLILHSPADGANPSLLQRVYYGLREGSIVVATQESLLDPEHLNVARRFSAVHLPWREQNNPWPMVGEVRSGQSVTGLVSVGFDDHGANPFLHTYHPDHDNLDATFTQALPTGHESYGVSRQITLNFAAPGTDFTSLTGGSDSLSGTYEETVTIVARGSESRTFNVRGHFALKRLAGTSELTVP